MSFDIAQSTPIHEALIRFNIAYRIRERPNVIPRPANAVNPRKAKALAARNMRAAANTAADVIVVIQPGTEGIIYDMNPPQLANGYTWLFVEIGSPVQYAGYVVEILGDKRSFEALPIVVEPPSDALYSVFLTADELQQSVSLHTQISQAHQQLAQIFSAALQRTQKK